jgi:conjugal transfer mating pair stabilization protein TraG
VSAPKLIDSFAKQNGISQEKSAQLLANASFGMGLSVGIDGRINASDREYYEKAQSFAKDHNYAEVKRASVNASSQLSHTLNDEKARRLAEETSASFEQSMSQRDESNKSYRESEDYNRQASFTRANSASINYNANQEFIKWLANQPADNTNGGTLGHREAGRIMASNRQLTMGYAQRFMQTQVLNPVNTVPNGNNLKGNYDKEQGHKAYDVNRNEFEGVRAQAKDLTNQKNTKSSEIRDSVKNTQLDTSNALEHRNQQISQREDILKDAHQAAKDQGVFERLNAKAAKETVDLITGSSKD